jgi:hypothetical protein
VHEPQANDRSEEPKFSETLDRTEASRTIVGLGLFNLGLRVHDKGTARDDRLRQWTTGIDESPQGFVLRLNRHPRCLPADAAREPNDVARCYELGLSADRALALQDDNDCVVVGREILVNHRIAYGARVVASAAAIEDSLYDPTNAALRA